jgi:hypothetical protein
MDLEGANLVDPALANHRMEAFYLQHPVDMTDGLLEDHGDRLHQ